MSGKIYDSLESIKQELSSLSSLAQKNWPDDKWALLYNHAMKAFELEVQRFHRLDDKSTKFITAISIVIATFSALINWFVGNEDIVFSPYVYVLMVLVFLMSSIAWVMFFFCLRLASIPVLDIADNMLEQFNNNNVATMRVAIFKGCQKAIKERRSISDRKAKFLRWGFNFTAISAFFVLLLVASMSAETFYQKNNFNQPVERVHMTEKKENTSPQGDNDEPNLDVEPMGFGVALEDDSSNFVPEQNDGG